MSQKPAWRERVYRRERVRTVRREVRAVLAVSTIKRKLVNARRHIRGGLEQLI
jgi:hypothetical protein